MTTTKPTNLADYYESIGLSPVEHDIKSEANYRDHEKKRRNLFETHLRFPLQAFRGARVLEFGPGSGENAVVMAKHGAKVTFVEPLKYLTDKLEKKFQDHGLRESITAIENKRLEEFCAGADKKHFGAYDVVIAEGFIHFLDEPAKALAEISKFVAPNGHLMISVIHPIGTFIEFMKKTVLGIALAKNPDLEDLKAAEALFGDDFKKINHSRGFESWARDTVLNPLYRLKSFCDLETAQSKLSKDFQVYSTWPNYFSADHMLWHKSFQTTEQQRAAVSEGYYSRAPYFIDATPRPEKVFALMDPKAGRKIVKAMDALLAEMDKGFENQFKNLATIAGAARTLGSAFDPNNLETSRTRELVGECATFFDMAGSFNTISDFARAYHSKGALRSLWGSPGHYFMFQKSC